MTIKRCEVCGGYMGLKIKNLKMFREWFDETKGCCPTCKVKITGQTQFVTNLLQKFSKKI